MIVATALISPFQLLSFDGGETTQIVDCCLQLFSTNRVVAARASWNHGPGRRYRAGIGGCGRGEEVPTRRRSRCERLSWQCRRSGAARGGSPSATSLSRRNQDSADRGRGDALA